ncbi:MULTISPECIES: tyrosine-type DNA invertase [Citrobacter]|uniref:tyrosine-type DNA invertase n=1 Tax=Citrobacter TaxID=544 RepID=UPI0011EE2907|nr:tyrosine-type DNA invertase [Citrobacter braakii]
MKERLYLTRQEVRLLIQATQGSRNQLRDHCMITFGYVHGLRVSELTGMRINDIDFHGGHVQVRRLKGGFSTIHPITHMEKEILSEWISTRSRYAGEDVPWLFLTEKGNRMSRQQFYKLLSRYGKIAGLLISPHPHMLRHGCGFALADQGLDTRLIQDYLGHKNIRHTVHYTAGNAARFSAIWKEIPAEACVQCCGGK